LASDWVARLIPEPFRDFLPYTSLSALRVIHTGQVLERALGIVQHHGSESLRAREADALSASLRKAGLPLCVERTAVGPLDVDGLSAATRAAIGAQVLDLYFHQLHSEGPWFLDLRPRHFAWSDERRSLMFYPSSLWYRPDPDFRRRVRALYAGFYRRDRAALSTGIELYSWGSRPLAGFADRIEQLLHEHFAPGDARETRFSIAHFRDTFEHVFRETAQSRAKLHPELTFLGVGLVGLYLTLERLQVPLNPRAAFEANAPACTGPRAA
jgi:hypothetical protein